jgi:hypothetical protein
MQGRNLEGLSAYLSNIWISSLAHSANALTLSAGSVQTNTCFVRCNEDDYCIAIALPWYIYFQLTIWLENVLGRVVFLHR